MAPNPPLSMGRMETAGGAETGWGGVNRWPAAWNGAQGSLKRVLLLCLHAGYIEQILQEQHSQDRLYDATAAARSSAIRDPASRIPW